MKRSDDDICDDGWLIMLHSSTSFFMDYVILLSVSAQNVEYFYVFKSSDALKDTNVIVGCLLLDYI